MLLPKQPQPTDQRIQYSKISEVFRFFFLMGLTAFGGPAAHIAIMQNELVKRRKWLTEEEFLDLLGVTNLIPGPNSTEMAIHIGLVRAGWMGFLAGGVGFVLPAFSIILSLAWVYSRYGTTPQIGWILYGIKPVVIAIIIQAVWQLGRKALGTQVRMLLGVMVVAGYLLGMNEILLLLGGGLLVLILEQAKNWKSFKPGFSWVPLTVFPPVAAGLFSFATLFFPFLKIGSVMYGSGYVLLAFLRSEFVVRLGWLTEKQLLDSVAVGQLTPGPFFTTATFIGYILGDLLGAILATLGMFLPSFLFVAISHRALVKYQGHPFARSLLNGVNATSLGLMAAVA
jgi:chromate transporter